MYCLAKDTPQGHQNVFYGAKMYFRLARCIVAVGMLNIHAKASPGCGSQDNRADEPSRDKPIRAPTIELPLWLADLQRQDPRRFDLIREANRVPQIAARWLRLLLIARGRHRAQPRASKGQTP